jgi:PEP-CTERM motif
MKRMRRLIYLLLLVLFVGASATCISASTDCERWFIAYRSELAHARNVQRIAAAKRRAKLYAQRKLAGYVAKPKPKLVLAKGPGMTRKETIHHFNLACGVLPEDSVDEPIIAEETPVPFDVHPLNDEIDLLPAPLGEMIAENDVPPPPTDGYSPTYPSNGGYPVYTPPFTGAVTPSVSGSSGSPGSPSTPPPPPSTPPVTPDVPEPASYVLLLTGMVGAAGAFRRRFKA